MKSYFVLANDIIIEFKGRHFSQFPGETHNGVARAFPGGRAAHPEDQNEEENKENLRKNERTYRKMRNNLGNVPILPTRE